MDDLRERIKNIIESAECGREILKTVYKPCWMRFWLSKKDIRGSGGTYYGIALDVEYNDIDNYGTDMARVFYTNKPQNTETLVTKIEDAMSSYLRLKETLNCVKIDPKEEMNKRFGNPYKDFLHGGIVNEFCCENRNEDNHTLNQQFGEAITNFLDGLCCHDKSKEDNMKKYTITECRECKYKVTTKDGEYNPNDIVCSYWMSDGLTEDDYCSRGVDGKYEGDDTDICEKLSCKTCKWGDKYEFDGENWDYICGCYGSPMFTKIMPCNHGCTRWAKKDVNN